MTCWLPSASPATDHGPLFTRRPPLAIRHSLLLPRSTPHDRWGPLPLPRAEPGTALPPGRRQYATPCYVFGFSAEVWRAWFSAQLNIKMGLTSISLQTLVGRDSRPNCLLKNELRRYGPRSRFPQKPPFRVHFMAFYPHPAHKSALRAEVAAHFLAPGKRGWSPLATVLPSHAPRRDQRGQVVRRPSPAGYCLTPTAELPRILRGPITPTGPPLLVCHRMDDSRGKINPSSPLAAARLLTIRSWPEALDATGSKRARQCTSTSFGSCSSCS
jgi:hypothetical protein